METMKLKEGFEEIYNQESRLSKVIQNYLGRLKEIALSEEEEAILQQLRENHEKSQETLRSILNDG